MDELLSLIGQYDPYYEMADDGPTWRRGGNIDQRLRALAKQLRAQGHGARIDSLVDQHPHLVSSPNGMHALAR